MFVNFVGKSIFIDYSGCSGRQFNSWLTTRKTDLLFFDFRYDVCFNSGNVTTIFGQGRSLISRSVNAKLKIITDDLFVIGGCSGAQPAKKHKTLRLRGGSGSVSLSPHITEVDAEDEESEES